MNARVSFVLAAAFVAACSSPSSTTASSPAPASAPATASLAGKTSTWDGVYTAAQAQRGAALFASTCDRCHGPSAAGTVDDGGRLVGKDFMGTYDGVTLDQLFNSIYTLMPADHPKTLPMKDVADITAYLLQQNQMPAGSVTLPADPAQLKSLKIAASKP
jgi:mono/diheme cytochrome c family protein